MFNDFPRTLDEFDSRFASEEACWDYLFSARWPNGFRCPDPACAGRTYCRLTRGRLLQCGACRKQTSITAGTVLHGTRKPLRLWFKAILLVSTLKTGVSAKALQRLLGLTYKAAWTWAHKLRRAISSRPIEPLRDNVEADEAYVGGHEEGVAGRKHGNKAVVLAAAEDRGLPTGRLRLVAVQDASSASLTPAVTNNVAPKSTVRTDKWQGYARLRMADLRHVAEKAGRKTASKRFPHVHRAIALLKRWLLGTYQGSVSRKHLPAYLDEFEFRFNRRRTRHATQIARTLVRLMLAARPTPYRAIVGSSKAS